MKTGGLIPAATSKKRWLLVGTHGSMTIPGICFFTIIMAVGGLAIDMQRLYGVHGQMQTFVDDAALAGAAELDGQDDAIARAFRAVHGDEAGGPQIEIPGALARFSPNGETPVLHRLTFLRGLSTNPADVLCSFEAGELDEDCNTDPDLSRDARFVEVVAQQQVGYGLIRLADVLQETLELRATAGFRRSMCNSVPLVMCNPSEAIHGTTSDFELGDFSTGRQMIGKINEGFEPANFILLDGFPGSIEDALAQVSPRTSCVEDQVNVRNDPVSGLQSQSMNVRFDLYEGLMTGKESNSNYAPAPNVVKGLVGGCGGTTLSSNSIPFPRDPCLMGGGGAPCTYGPRIGDGGWTSGAYWDTNHDGMTAPPGGRYQSYLEEIGKVGFAADEPVNPTCNAYPQPERRILYVPVVNCLEHGASGTNRLGNLPVPVKAYAKIFLTEPVGNTRWSDQERAGLRWPPVITDKDIAYEIVDVVKPNDTSGRLHVYPVLFR